MKTKTEEPLSIELLEKIESFNHKYTKQLRDKVTLDNLNLKSEKSISERLIELHKTQPELCKHVMERLVLGFNLDKIMKKRGVSVNQLSKHLNTTPYRVNELLSGMANPTLKTLSLMAHYLQCDVRHFFLIIE